MLILFGACNAAELRPLAEQTDGPKILNPGRQFLNITQVIDGQSVERTVHLVAPNSLDADKSYPIYFAFHGAGGNGAQFLNNSVLNNQINSGAFVGVYPNGHNTFWNLGSENSNADDLEFVQRIIDELLEYKALDASKIYAVGFSNGAGMVNLLGKSSSYFKAIAPLFSQQIQSTARLTPQEIVSVFQVVGELDPIVPSNGGSAPVGEFLSEEESALNWVNHFNCNSIPVTEDLNWGSTKVTRYRYLNCDGENEIARFVAWNTGHGLPPQANAFAFNAIWNFFKSR